MGQDRLERPSKRLHLGQQKDHISSVMANSSKTLAMPTSGQGIKKPSQPCVTDRRRGSSSQIPNAQVSRKRKDPTSSHLAFQERKSTHNGESQAVYLKQPLDKHGSSRSSGENSATSHCSRKLIKTKTEQPICGVAHHAEPISVVCPGMTGNIFFHDSGTSILVQNFVAFFSCRINFVLYQLSAQYITFLFLGTVMVTNF